MRLSQQIAIGVASALAVIGLYVALTWRDLRCRWLSHALEEIPSMFDREPPTLRCRICEEPREGGEK